MKFPLLRRKNVRLRLETMAMDGIPLRSFMAKPTSFTEAQQDEWVAQLKQRPMDIYRLERKFNGTGLCFEPNPIIGVALLTATVKRLAPSWEKQGGKKCNVNSQELFTWAVL
jgi:hypothetical protein